MLVEIEALLDSATAARFRETLDKADWKDGRTTAGYQSALAKNNLQLPETSQAARLLGSEIVAALSGNLLFQSAALPDRIFPPLFNCYRSGHGFGMHIDNAYRPLPGGQGRIRTDVSATLFLSDPAEYDGGELLIDDGFEQKKVKLPAGHMILYAATTLHSVAPVTRGTRLASFFWIQSLVADAAKRAILFDMDLAIQSLRARVGDEDPGLVALTGSYHNLLRLWSSG